MPAIQAIQDTQVTLAPIHVATATLLVEVATGHMATVDIMVTLDMVAILTVVMAEDMVTAMFHTESTIQVPK